MYGGGSYGGGGGSYGGGGGMYGGGGGMYGGGGGMYGGGGGMYGGGGGDMGQTYRTQDLGMLIQQTVGKPEDWAPDDWTGFTWGTGEGTIMPYPSQQPKKLAIYQTHVMHRQIQDLLDQMRKGLGHQVSIEARFLVVSENFLEDIGLNMSDVNYVVGGKWGQLLLHQGSALATQQEATKVPMSLGMISPAAIIRGGYGSILDDLQVTFLLRATQGRTDTETLTAPIATVVSGESASLSIQDQTWYVLPASVVRTVIPGWDIAGQQNLPQLPAPQQVISGTFLNVTPTIMQDKKNVLLNINASLNELLRMYPYPMATVIGDRVEDVPVLLPETETSQIMTRVSVPDGGTLLLGGQKITAQVEKEVGVPVLSKIPILGRLFGNRSIVKDQRILLILVKPTIILQEEREAEAIAEMEKGS
jgi:general secretion pathway protein D